MRNLIIFSIVLGLIGCDDKESDDELNAPFRVGVISENSTIQTFDDLVIEAQTTYGVYDTFDVDKDGTYDFILSSRNSNDRLSKVAAINVYNRNFEIAYNEGEIVKKQYVFSQNDTLFEVNYDFELSFDHPSDAKIDTVYQGYRYPKIFGNNNVGDSESWDNNWLYFCSKDSNWIFNESLNKVFIQYYNYDDWVSDEPHYMVFRLNKSGLKYYGWIKLQIAEYNRLKIEEIYFQKNGFTR